MGRWTALEMPYDYLPFFVLSPTNRVECSDTDDNIVFHL